MQRCKFSAQSRQGLTEVSTWSATIGGMIELNGLTKRFGRTVAVDDLTFTVEPGRVTGFLGPNGAGKTTTMRMILGLDAPTSGTVTVRGRRYADLPVPMREVGAGVGLVAMLAVAGWFAVRAGLRPLRRIERTAAAIAGGDLTQRVPAGAGSGTEIGRLSTALNGMLGQVEAAFAARAASEARMRRFVADVSHELRTPLFGIKGFTELYRMGGVRGEAEVGLTMARIESESARLTEDLLLLARLDEGGTGLPPHPAPMDLRTLAAGARRDLTALDPTRPVTVTGPRGRGPAGPALVSGDEARLRQVAGDRGVAGGGARRDGFRGGRGGRGHGLPGRAAPLRAT